MRKRLTLLTTILVLTMLLLSGCGGSSKSLEGAAAKAKLVLHENKNLQTVDVKTPGQKAPWLKNIKANAKKPYTLMVYMNGTDLESEGGCATNDLKEIIASGWDSDKVNVVLLTGGTKKWDNKVIRPKETMVYRVAKDGFYEDVKFSKASIASANTLSNFIAYALKAYPADQYSLVFWNHGGGPINGYGSDEMYKGDSLDLPGIYRGIKEGGVGKQQLSFVGFDACLMASVENAYLLKDFAHYLVASEESEPGLGWNYSWLKNLGDKPTQSGADIGKVIVDTFVSTCEKADMEATLSVINLDKINNLAQAFDNFGAASQNVLVKGNYNAIAKARSGSKSFGYTGKGEYNFDLVDIFHLAKQSEQIVPEQAKALQSAVKDAVVYSKSSKSVKNSYGIMTYLPYATKETAMPQAQFYNTLNILKPYASFLDLYAKKMNGKKIPRDAIANVKPTVNKQEVFIQLGKDQLADLDKARFVIWRQLEKNSDYFIQLGMSSDVKIGTDGKIDTKFDGYWATVAGEPICLYEVDKNEERTKYSAPVKFNGKPGYLIVVKDSKDKDGRILGFEPQGLKGGRIASKDLIKVKSGDKVVLQYFAELFLKDTNKAGGQAKAKWVDGKEVTLKDDKLKVKAVDNQLYLYGFWITDTMGNDYYTKFIEIRY